MGKLFVQSQECNKESRNTITIYREDRERIYIQIEGSILIYQDLDTDVHESDIQEQIKEKV